MRIVITLPVATSAFENSMVNQQYSCVYENHRQIHVIIMNISLNVSFLGLMNRTLSPLGVHHREIKAVGTPFHG